MAALALAVVLYVLEVVARYLFASPTTWSGEAVQYALAVIVFGALPDITRRRAHIAIEMVPDLLPPGPALWLGRFNTALGAAACGAAAWIVGREAARQLAQGLMTNAAHPIPRWPITALIALGLALAALHFLRALADRRVA